MAGRANRKRITTAGAGAAARLLVFVCAAVLFCACRADAINTPYTLNSNYILLDIDKKIVYCEGQSEFMYKKIRFQAKTIRVDVKSHILYAEGSVIMTTMATSESTTTSSTQVLGVGGTEQTMAEEADERLKEEIKSRENSGIRTFEGDQLRFDIERMAGELIQTRKATKRIYLQGEALQEMSDLPVIGEGTFLYDEPEITTNAVTATRLRVSPADQYEAWQAKLWVKGNKVISLPYYTNTSKKVTPGNWRLTNIRYSSNTNWGIGTSVRYKETKGKQGFFDVVYDADSPSQYKASVKQAFKLGERVGGGLSISNLLSGTAGYALSLSRHSGTARSTMANMSFSHTGQLDFQLSGNTRWNKNSIRGYLHTSRLSSSGISNVNAIVSLDRGTRYIGKSRKLGWNMNAHADLTNNKYQDSENSAFVGVSAFRSGINITNKSMVNLSVSSGIGMASEGTARISNSVSVRYNYKMGRGKLFNFSYNTRAGRSAGSASADQSLSASVSMSHSSRWNMSVGSAYSLRTSKIGELNTTLDYTFSKKCRLWSSLIYDTEDQRFDNKNFNMTYMVYGTQVNLGWMTEGNDFFFDVASNFR